MTHRTHVFFGLISVVVSLMLLLSWKYIEPIVPLDEGIILVYPELILKGYIPNLDFCSLYPPGNFWLVAFFFKIFGPGLAVERMVGVGYVLGIAFAVFTLAVNRGVVLAVVSAIMVGIVLQMFSDAMAAYSWFGAVALALWSMVVGVHRLKLPPDAPAAGRLLLLVGALGGLAILFRHDLAPAIVLSSLGMAGIRPRTILTYGAGFLIGASPLLIHALFATPTAVFENMVLDVLRAGPGRRLPLNMASPFLWTIVLSCIAPAVFAAIQALAFGWARRDRILLGAALLCLGVLPQALSRADRWHLAYVGCFTIPLAFISMLHVYESFGKAGSAGAVGPRWLRRARWAWNAGSLVFVSLTAAVFVLSFNLFWLELASFRKDGQWACTTCLVNEGRSLPVPRDLEALRSVVSELEARSRPGDTLFIGPRDLARTNYSDPFLFYFFPKLEPSQFYIEMASAVANRPGTRTSGDLSRAKFVLLSTAYDRWNEKNASALRGSEEPLQVLDREFCLMMDRKPLLLYGKCDWLRAADAKES